MTDFYLVTGFLGAGKTSFLKNFIRLFPSKRLQLIINEFGREGVDGKLLQEVGAALREINGGSVFCSCRLDKFEEALEDGLKNKPDVLIVEASGLSDPTNIRKLLDENERAGRLKYRGCICLIDAVKLRNVIETARVCGKQLAVGDLLLINKTDIATKEQIFVTRQLILNRYPNANIHETAHGAVELDWIKDLDPYRRKEGGGSEAADITLQRATVQINEDFTRYELDRFIAMFAEDTNRLKGFVYLRDSGWLLVDCVGSLLSIEPWAGSAPISGLNALATAGMPLRKSLKHAAEWYEGRVTLTFG